MNAATWRWIAAVPAPIYVALVAGSAEPAITPAGAAMAIALALPLVSLVTSRFGSWWYVPAAVGSVATVGLAVEAGSVAAAAVAPLVLGMLLGAPAFVLALFGTMRRSAAAGALGIIGVLAASSLDLAVVRGLAATAPSSAHAWAVSFSAVITAQGQALRDFATGAAVPAAPLSYTGDGVFDVLAAVAALGMLVSWLDPVARAGGADAATASLADRRVPDLSGPTADLGPSGTRSLVTAVAAVLAFEAGAAVTPVGALFALAVAAPIVVVVVVGLTRRRSAAAAGAR